MTGQQIDRDRLRELADNATPGPWERGYRYHVQGSSMCECRPDRGPLVGIDPDGEYEEMHIHRTPEPIWDEGITARDDSVGGISVIVENSEYWTMSVSDAEFIAAARTALPALLDEVDRLTRERDEARARAEAAEAALRHIRLLHRHATSPVVGDYCADCDIEWPCPTIQELDKEDA